MTFNFHRIQSATLDDIRRTLLDFYEDSAISSAKSKLWDGYQMHLDATFNTERNNRGRSKKEKEVEDILSGVRDIEKVFSRNEDFPVIFAANNLENLPSIPAIEQPKHKEPPAQNNVHDTGSGSGSG